MNMLKSVRAQALEPEKFESLLHLIREDLGYHLHQAVQKVKCDLSNEPSAMFYFSDGAIELQASVERDLFEEWIKEELEQIAGCVDSLLERSRLHFKKIDRVFLTGGSSFVPSVRKIFETRFGADRIRAGNEFTSVVRGLALQARKPD